MSSEKIDLEENDYPLGIKIFTALRWIMVGCLILTFIGGLYLLLKGYPWYFVIPGYFVLNFLCRVLRSYFRNIAEDLQSEYDELGDQTF